MVFFIIAILFITFLWVCSYTYLRRGAQLPPSPHALPLLGHLHMLTDLPHRDLHRLSQKYGPIMYMQLGLKPAVVVSSPQAAELILKTYDHIFANRPNTQAGEIMSYGHKAVAWTPYGSYWRKMRKVCTMELLSNSKVDLFKSTRKEELDNLIQSLRDAAGTGTVVDLTAKIGLLIEDITYRMVFGAGKGCKFNIRPVILEAVRLAGAFNIADYIPFLAFLDLQGLGRCMKAVTKAQDELFEKIIDEHVQEAKYQQSHHRDIIDVMLSLIVKSKNEDEEQVIDRTHIKAMIVDILAGTLDSSAAVIDWAMVELIRHPMVMKSLQEELENVVGINRIVEEKDLDKLKYLDMVIKESMRLHPVGPLLVPRESMEDVIINGYHIPKKCRIFVNTWAMGRNTDVWSSNVEEFLPERFMDGSIDVLGHDFQLIPFGSGRRGCPGMQMGLRIIRLVLAQLVHCFNWELPNGISPDKLDMSERFGLSLPRAHNLYVLPTYRLHVKNI